MPPLCHYGGWRGDRRKTTRPSGKGRMVAEVTVGGREEGEGRTEREGRGKEEGRE